MPAPTLVIVNPASRAGATGRRWARVEAQVREALGPLEVERTRGPRDAERVAREAARAGVERLVVAGGDGTASEVVTGLLAAGLAGEVRIALLPLGTGGDLRRTLGVPGELDAALAQLAKGAERRIDAGRLEYAAADGSTRVAFFANVASFGLGGLVDALVARAPRLLGGSAAFLWASLQAVARYRAEPVRLRVDGELAYQGRVALVAAANGRFFGGGMQIAPEARIDDGLFDVVVVPALPRLRLVANMPSLYRGTHLAHPEVTLRRGTRVEVECAGAPLLLDVDGEPLGSLPARFELLPGALTVFGAAG